VTSQQLEAGLGLAVPHAHGVIGAAGEQLGSVGREVAVAHSCCVPMELGHGLQSMQGFLVPALVVDNIGDSNAGRQNENITSAWIVGDALYVPAHVLLLVFRQEHDIVVDTELLRFKVDHVDTAAESRRHH